ncbi:MAG: signal transduction histidine kinase, partial [Phenylobacterium sp.]
TLAFHQNLMSFEFAALHFSNPMKNRYAYQLEGQDKDWIYTDAKNRRATYTNIAPGQYTLRVKAANKDGYWNQQIKSLTVVILPPPWKTWWAYAIYTSVFCTLVLALVAAQRRKLLSHRDKLLYHRRKIQDKDALNRQLRQVDKLKDEFLANTSHELRTPLNSIVSLAESLKDGIAGPQSNIGHTNLAMIVSSGKRLAHLVEDILDFSKLKTNNMTLNLQPVGLHCMADVVLTLTQPLIGDKDIKLINAIPLDFSAALADEDRLQQVFYNLLGNAIKFTDKGKITVTAVINSNQLTVSITDTGIGIAKNHFTSLFEPFAQIENKHRVCSGTGLGLAVSKQLVELHGGEITVESEPGHGSVFSFTLQASSQKLSPELGHLAIESTTTQSADATTENRDSRRDTADGSQFRILLVDDELVNRRILCNHLSQQNYQLVEACGGAEALALIAQNGPFDLILLDIMMPGVSGYEVCHEIREKYPVNDLPVIFLTAKNEVADLVQSFAAGANDYLNKPISRHELLARIEIHLKFLDIHRNLESKVAGRTRDLEQAYHEIEQKNHEIVAAQQQLMLADKMASLGTLTAGVAHEINNPTNFVHVSAQNLEVDLSRCQQFILELAGEDVEEAIVRSFTEHFSPLYAHLTTIKNGTERIKTIVKSLRTFSQLDEAEFKVVRITELLQSTMDLVQTKYLEVAGFVTDFEAEPDLLCNPAQLNQVFMNLIVNACDAIRDKQRQQNTRERGQIVIGCRVLGRSHHQQVEISIKDDGCGMTEETKTKLFEPFYTTKGVGEGTGLGLSISYGIIEQHHWTLNVESELGVGTVFLLSLPMKVEGGSS